MSSHGGLTVLQRWSERDGSVEGKIANALLMLPKMVARPTRVKSRQARRRSHMERGELSRPDGSHGRYPDSADVVRTTRAKSNKGLPTIACNATAMNDLLDCRPSLHQCVHAWVGRSFRAQESSNSR